MKLFGAVIAVGVLVAAGVIGSGQGEKPVIKVHLDERVSEIQAHSTFRFPEGFLRGDPAFDWVTVPHIFIYEDSTLKLRIPDAGGLRTLGTNLWTSPPHPERGKEAAVYSIGVHALPDYSVLPTAIQRAREIQAELLAQGFTVQPRPWKSRFRAALEKAPTRLDTLDDLQAAFLDTAFFAEEAIVFDMVKGRLRIEASIVNGRRRWGSRTDSTDRAMDPTEERAAKESATMSKKDLIAEPSYSLHLSIGPTESWAKEQDKDW